AEVLVREEAHPPADLLGDADANALTSLQRPDEVAGVVERVKGAGVEPCGSPREHLDLELATVEVDPVEVGDLELATGRRSQAAGEVDDLVVVEVEAWHGVRALRLRRLLLQRQGAAFVVELDHAVLGRVRDL